MRESTLELFERLADDHWFFEGRRRVFDTFLDGIPAGEPDSVVLDAGCCSGAMMEQMSRLGGVFGFDLSARALRACHGRGLRNVCKADLPRMPFADGTLNLVTAFDVIEHIEDEASALGELRRVTRSGGRVVLSVPAYQFMWSPDDDLAHHKRRYTRGALKKRLESAGFYVERISYFYTILFPLNLLLLLTRKIFRIQKTNEDVGLGELPRLLNACLLGTLRLEARLLERFDLPFGLFVVSVARKAGE
jgi:SAM-dependent methyltransferase